MPQLPPLDLATWKPTRDSLHNYAKLLGAVRRSMAPPQPHWWHISLLPTASGLGTGALPAGDGRSLALELDLERHLLWARCSDGRRWARAMEGQSARELASDVMRRLGEIGAAPEPDFSTLDAGVDWRYDRQAAGAWWAAARTITGALTCFSAELPGKKSPVQLWPHHFDLSLVWFSGRRVAGVDPADEERAEEQMAFGFSTGDMDLPEPYVYATAYPFPESMLESPLPAPATWFTDSWKGGLLRYTDLAACDDPIERLMEILRASQAAGAARMSA